MRIHFVKVQALITDLIDRLQGGLGRTNEKNDFRHASMFESAVAKSNTEDGRTSDLRQCRT